MTEPVLARQVFDGDLPSGIVAFTAMADGTADDYALLDRYERVHAAGLADRVLDTLARLEGSMGGYQISRLEHSLQSATKMRTAGGDVDWVVAALVHDIGDELAPYNHSEFAAALLRPYVREEVHWVIQQHGVFQSYYYAHFQGGDRNGRDQFAGHPWYELCLDFCERFDQNCFDPTEPVDSLESFRSEVAAVFGRPAWNQAVIAKGTAQLPAHSR